MGRNLTRITVYFEQTVPRYFGKRIVFKQPKHNTAT